MDENPSGKFRNRRDVLMYWWIMYQCHSSAASFMSMSLQSILLTCHVVQVRFLTHVPLTCNPDILGLAILIERGDETLLPLRTGLSSFIADARQRTRDGAKISARLKELSQLSSGGNQLKAPKSAPKRKRSGESKALRQKRCVGTGA